MPFLYQFSPVYGSVQKWLKDSMNKMIKKNKRWFRYVCFLVNQKERNKKKMIQKFVWKIKKNVRIHDDDFFSEKMRLFVQKKKT